LLNFFTAYDYNQDYTTEDPSLAGTDAYKFWRQARDRMDSKFSDSTALTNILRPYIDKIIGVDRIFASEQIFIPDEQGQYFRNAFFNISGEYIPSSAIIQAIIDQLNKKKTASLADMVTATFSATHSGSGPERSNPNITNNMVTQVFGDRLAYAENTTIRYDLTIDVARLVEQIYPK
jgi:predicted nucleotidyltransferase